MLRHSRNRRHGSSLILGVGGFVLTPLRGTGDLGVRASLIASLLAAAALFATPALAWQPPADAMTALRAGGAWADVNAEPQGVGLIHGVVDIAAPPQAVWRVMTDCRETPKLIASSDPCRVMSADPKGAWDVREQVTRGGLLMPTIHNIYRSDYQPFSLIRFHRVGGDLKLEDGSWQLLPLNGGRATRVIYTNRIATNLLAPAALVEAALKNDTPKVLINLRREVMRGAT
jgi:hypothetical protein